MAQSGRFIDFAGFFHANNLTILAAAELPHPANNCAPPADVVLALHGLRTEVAGFHFPHRLHFKGVTISNYFIYLHSTWIFSFQSTNLFQDGTGRMNYEG